MKLNFDAIRELLLVIEEQPRNIDVNKVVFDKKLENFDQQELGYALEKMIESHLLIGKVGKSKNGTAFLIDSISVEGHQFIDAIRQNTVWEKTKSVATNLGISTVRTLMTTATEVFNKYISGII